MESNNNNSIPISQGKEYILYKQNKINNVNKYSNQDKDIIEGNYWHDVYWGQCTCEKCVGKGKNKLVYC